MIPPGWRTPDTTVYRRNLPVPKATIDGRSIATRFKQAFAHVPEAYEWESSQVRIIGTEYFARFVTTPYIIPLAAYLNVELIFEPAVPSVMVLITHTSDPIVDEAGNPMEIGE
jgi:hypothetical protein